MSDNHGKQKHDWMAGLFGPDLWSPPVDLDCVTDAPLDASRRAGAGVTQRTSRALEPDSAVAKPYNCSDITCSCTHPFRSRWELDRHIQSVHSNSKDFACPYPGCFQGPQVSAFAHPDKLTSHIKSCHGRQTEVHLACPAASCSVPACKLDDLAAHIRADHLVDSNKFKQKQRCGGEIGILRAVANAAPSSS